MHEERAPFLAVRELQQKLLVAHSLEGAHKLVAAFLQTHLDVTAVDLAPAVSSQDHTYGAGQLAFSVDNTGYCLKLERATSFTPDETALLQMVATFLTDAPPLRATNELKPTVERLQLLQRMNRVVVAQDFGRVAAVLSATLISATPQANGRLLLLDRAARQFRVQSTLGEFEEEKVDLAPVPIAGSVQQVMETGETAVLADSSPPQLWIPIPVGDEIEALCHIVYPETADIPLSEVTFLELLVGYVGIALNNDRMLAQAWQRANQLETIFRVTESARALKPLEQTLHEIQERLIAAFKAPASYVALYDPESQLLSFPWIVKNGKRVAHEPISILDDRSLVAWVVANNQPFVTGDSHNDPPPAPGIIIENLPRSIICYPLRSRGEVLGVISIQNDAPDAFDETDFQTLVAIAAHIAVIIKNARLYTKTRQLVDQSTRDYQTAVLLRQAIAVISTTLEPEAVLEQLLLALDTVIDYETAFAFLTRDSRLKLGASRDTQGRPLKVTTAATEEHWSQSPLVQQALAGKAPLVLANTEAEPAWTEPPGEEGVRSWMAVPLVAQGDILGILLAHNHRRNAFGEREKWLATTLGTHTAVALHNAILYQRSQRQLSELSTLYQASATMTANLDQDFVLQTVVGEMVRALKVESCTIFVWDERRQLLKPAAHKNLLQPERPLAEQMEGEGVGLLKIEQLAESRPLRHLFETQEVYTLRRDGDAPAEDVELLQTAGLQSVLLVPLVRRQKVLGVMALGYISRTRQFPQGEKWLVRNLAEQAAVAIEHADLFTQAQRRIAELSTFHKIVLQLNTPLKLSAVLDTITEAALKLVDASNLHIYLYDNETDTFTFGSALWRDGRRQAAVKSVRRKGITATVAEQGQPIVINDASDHPLFSSETAQAWGICAIAGFPLRHGDRVIGVFTITYLEPHTFSEDELLLLNLLADQAAVAVRNAGLFSESQRRLRDMAALVEMAKQVTGNLKLNSVLQTTVQNLGALLDARASTITMLTDDQRELVVVAAAGIDPEFVGKARMKVGEGVSGEAVRTRQRVYIQDAHQEPDFLFFSDVVRSLLVVPLIIRDEAIGTLTVDSDEPNAFDQSDIQLLTVAAAQVSVAITNARLFEEVEERAAELAIAYEELKESDRLKDELVQNVSHELRTPLTFVKGYVDLLMEGEMGLLSPEQVTALEIVATKTDEITRLIEDIITLQRIDSGNLQLVDMSVNRFLETAVSSHQIVARQKGLSLVSDFPDKEIYSSIDKGRINQVVDNLLGNAMKFSPDGGTITIKLEESEDEALITISDEGIGIPPEKQTKIFERFYQVDGSSRRRFGGTGIGLAIVKRIVNAHNGRIWVESQPHKGSTFYFTLPRVETEAVDDAVLDFTG